MVSLLPRITEATRPARLSAPLSDKICSKRAIEPLPEKGRSSKREPHSGGKPTAFKTGEISAVKSYSPPEARKTEIITTRQNSEGKISSTVLSPSVTPAVNSEKTSVLRQSPKISIPVKNRGIIKSVNFIAFYRLFFREYGRR